MMSTTHIVIGIASALTVFQPDSVEAVLPVLAGASVGSIICDIDCRSKPKKRDALIGRLIVAGLLVAVLLIDYEIGQPLMKYVNSMTTESLIALFLFLVCGGMARVSPHRGFSHSLIAMAIYAGALFVMVRPLAGPFFIAFVSPLLLDVMNKTPVRVMWPAEKGVCLKWFYANGKVNKVMMIAGAAWAGVEMYFALGK